MSTVLHLQSRAYPLQHSAGGRQWDTVTVPGLGSFKPEPGLLKSMAYNVDSTVDIDLTSIVHSSVALEDVTIEGCRLRILPAGTVILTYALRHGRDLTLMDAQTLAAFDADVNQRLRRADAEVISAVFAAAVAARVLELPTGRDGRPVTLDSRAVRYNCHLITERPLWTPDPRVPSLVVGPGCQILLPFTYAWAGDATAPLAQIVQTLEPTDIAVAQLSLLVGATLAGRWILTELGDGGSGLVEGDDFRRFLDRLWADYYHLDSYRVESAQDHRATYLAACQTMGLDGARERAERMLRHVSASLLAESSSRSERLDRRLNRVAAALTVVAGGGFLVDAVGFLIPQAPWPVRAGIVGAVVAGAVGALMMTVMPGRQAARAAAGMASGLVEATIPKQRQPVEPAEAAVAPKV